MLFHKLYFDSVERTKFGNKKTTFSKTFAKRTTFSRPLTTTFSRKLARRTTFNILWGSMRRDDDIINGGGEKHPLYPVPTETLIVTEDGRPRPKAPSIYFRHRINIT